MDRGGGEDRRSDTKDTVKKENKDTIKGASKVSLVKDNKGKERSGGREVRWLDKSNLKCQKKVGEVMKEEKEKAGVAKLDGVEISHHL